MRLVNGLTDIVGIRVGHASDFDGLTGCTAILIEGGAAAGVDVRGSATGTEELELLNPLHVSSRIDAVVLAGGSAFGLEAASGVRRLLEKRGVGFPTLAGRVPLVVSAILYDLAVGKASARPTREMGALAAESATAGPVAEGNVGAGTGASVGKLFGIERAMKSGIGTAAVSLTGRFGAIRVAALTATNAFGDVIEPGSGRIVAGARGPSGFAGSASAMLRGEGRLFFGNTTLAVVATNAKLTKVEATKLAQLAQHGMVRSISPVHTAVDGDVVIALSAGTETCEVNALGVAAAEAVSRAILRSVEEAAPLGGLPGLKKPA
jgi:L-aminopeptidase/D-esterase-like protein